MVLDLRDQPTAILDLPLQIVIAKWILHHYRLKRKAEHSEIIVVDPISNALRLANLASEQTIHANHPLETLAFNIIDRYVRKTREDVERYGPIVGITTIVKKPK